MSVEFALRCPISTAPRPRPAEQAKTTAEAAADACARPAPSWTGPASSM
ncbi:hypothetical protein ACWEPL_40530 [Nonomuraea sp. NPDC004186]